MFSRSQPLIGSSLTSRISEAEMASYKTVDKSYAKAPVALEAKAILRVLNNSRLPSVIPLNIFLTCYYTQEDMVLVYGRDYSTPIKGSEIIVNCC